MLTHQPSCGVLYVDDEEKALKYFRLAFAEHFEIFTASSGAEGLALLAQESRRIGIVLSDQRMPGMLGADFLSEVRENYPRIIRILTTAFSDLQSAVQAVNRGHIYQYVVKPWDVPAFSVVLRRAADFYDVTCERDALLALKLTTLQRIVCSDRAKNLLLHARSLPERDGAHFQSALAALVAAVPVDLLSVDAAGGSTRRFEIGPLLEREFANAVRLLEDLAHPPPAPALEAPLVAELEKLAPAPADAADSFRAAAATFLAALLARPEAAGAEVDFCAASPAALRVDLRLAARPGLSALATALFDVLIGSKTSPLGTAVLRLLTELAPRTGTLTVTLRAGEEARSFEFSPSAPAGSAEEIIHALAEKYSVADIASL